MNPNLDFDTRTWISEFQENRENIPQILSLVLVWSRWEPHRVGEFLSLPISPGQPTVFGRGRCPEALAKRWAFGSRSRDKLCGSPLGFSAQSVSRKQLQIIQPGPEQLLIESIGKGPVEINGKRVEHGLLKAGDVLDLASELLFYCALRPLFLGGARGDDAYPSFPFAGADTFGIVGESPAVWALRRSLQRKASLTEPVLILGDSGVGKELVAAAIHKLSPRGDRDWVVVNAAAIPDALLECEVFGNDKNHPNVGQRARKGLVGQSAGSSFYMDEVGELSYKAQAKFLRFLETGEYHRLGVETVQVSDARVLCATNRSPEALRHDFAPRFRLRVEVPALESRREDIPLIVAELLRQMAEKDPGDLQRFFVDGDIKGWPRFSPAFVVTLLTGHWPGNVRDLDLFLRRCVEQSRDQPLVLNGDFYLYPTSPERVTASSEKAVSLPQWMLTRMQTFDEEERGRLDVLRSLVYSTTRCIRSKAYPYQSRESATNDRRRLILRSLAASEWNVQWALCVMANESPDPRGKWSMNPSLIALRKKFSDVLKSARGPAPKEELRALAEAIRDGKVKGTEVLPK